MLHTPPNKIQNATSSIKIHVWQLSDPRFIENLNVQFQQNNSIDLHIYNDTKLPSPAVLEKIFQDLSEKNTKLNTIVLREVIIDEALANNLIKCFKNNITAIAFYENSFTEPVVTKLMEALKAFASIKTIGFGEQLNLSAETTTEILKLLSEKTNLSSLNLHSLNLNDEGISILLKLIKDNPALKCSQLMLTKLSNNKGYVEAFNKTYSDSEDINIVVENDYSLSTQDAEQQTLCTGLVAEEND